MNEWNRGTDVRKREDLANGRVDLIENSRPSPSRRLSYHTPACRYSVSASGSK